METVWTVILLKKFYGQEIVRGFYGENTINQITMQSPYQFYQKRIALHTVSMLSTYSLHIMETT